MNSVTRRNFVQSAAAMAVLARPGLGALAQDPVVDSAMDAAD